MKSQICLEAYNGSTIKKVGACNLKLHFKNKYFVCSFYIVECETGLLGQYSNTKANHYAQN